MKNENGRIMKSVMNCSHITGTLYASALTGREALTFSKNVFFFFLLSWFICFWTCCNWWNSQIELKSVSDMMGCYKNVCVKNWSHDSALCDRSCVLCWSNFYDKESCKNGKHQTATRFAAFYSGFNHVSWFVAENEMVRLFKSLDLPSRLFFFT